VAFCTIETYAFRCPGLRCSPPVTEFADILLFRAAGRSLATSAARHAVRYVPSGDTSGLKAPILSTPHCSDSGHPAATWCSYALDAQTGKIEYRQELEIPSAGGMPGMEAANIYGSLTMVGKHLLLTNDVGGK
jgi:hypothetical protein